MQVSVHHNTDWMKSHMTGIQDSPEVYWYAQSPDALPDTYGTAIANDAALLEQYRSAGMTAEAERQEQILATRKQEFAHGALSQHHVAMDELEPLLRDHFAQKVKPNDYRGKDDEQTPYEVLVRLGELRTKKLGAFHEPMLEGHANECVFDKVNFWVADDGEVLIVGIKKFGEISRKYLIGQWRPDGSPHTRADELQHRKELAQRDAAARQARRTRRKAVVTIAYGMIVSAMFIGIFAGGISISAFLPLLMFAIIFDWPGKIAKKFIGD